MIRVTINGKPRELVHEMNIIELLRLYGREPQLIVVEVNGEIIHFPEFEQTLIREGDRLEIVHMVAGGGGGVTG